MARVGGTSASSALCISLGCFAISPAIFAQDGNELTLVGALAYQNKSLSFDQQYRGADTNQAEFTADLPVVNVQFTAAYGKYFASVKFEKNLSDTPTDTDEDDRSLVGQANLIALEGSDVDVGREDLTFTVGMNVWKSMNVFVGYLFGETQLTPNAFCANPFPQTGDTACSQSNRAFFQYFIDESTYKQEYTEEGPYIGLSYAFRFEDHGTLSLSFAYADMDGEYRDNANDPNNVFADPVSGLPTFVSFNYEGSTTGTSLGATWTASLGDTTAYFIDIRRQAYSMEGDDVTGLPNFNGISLETDEEMLGLTTGVQFYF